MGHNKHIVPLAHVAIKDRDFNVFVSVNTYNQDIHVFKYNEDTGTCAYDVFARNEEVLDFLDLPLPKSTPKHY
jgi:hypothetical protein